MFIVHFFYHSIEKNAFKDFVSTITSGLNAVLQSNCQNVTEQPCLLMHVYRDTH